MIPVTLEKFPECLLEISEATIGEAVLGGLYG